MTGTQQLSALWNNLKDEEREFFSKRLSISNYREEEEEELLSQGDEQFW